VGQGSGFAVSCDVGHRYSLDPALLWLWYRPEAVALIQPLALELPYAMDMVLKKKELEKEKQTKPKVSRRKEIIKIREYINKIEIQKTIEKKSIKPRAGF